MWNAVKTISFPEQGRLGFTEEGDCPGSEKGNCGEACKTVWAEGDDECITVLFLRRYVYDGIPKQERLGWPWFIKKANCYDPEKGNCDEAWNIVPTEGCYWTVHFLISYIYGRCFQSKVDLGWSWFTKEGDCYGSEKSNCDVTWKTAWEKGDDERSIV